MRKINAIVRHVVAAFIIIMVFLVLQGNAFAEENDKKIVKVGYYENENFQEGASKDAIKSGYSYEYLQKIATYNEWRYEYVYGSWTELYDAFIKGDIDLLAGLGYSEDRLDIMNYSNYPMGFESYYLFVQGDNSAITIDPKSLSGKKIGTISGLMEKAIREWLKENNIDASIMVYPDVHDRDGALKSGKIDAFIGESASVSFKGSIIPLLKIENVSMYLCVAKQRQDILEELNYAQECLDSKEPYYLNDLSKKYFSKSTLSLQVAAPEAEWLEAHDYTITVGYMDNFMPYCGTDENGNATGIMVDVIESAFSNIHSAKPIKFEYRSYNSTNEMIKAIHSHELEILFPISDDIYYLEQNNLYHSVDVIKSAMNLVYLENPSAAESGVLAINKNNQIQYNYVENYFPDNEVLYFDTVEECLDAVVQGKANGAILSGLRASVLLKEDKYTKLSYMELPHNSDKCFGVSTAHKGILPLINQALNSIEENSAVNYSFKYVNSSEDYSIAEFFRRYKTQVIFVVMLFVVALVILIANDIVKTQKQKMYYEYAYKDGLTKLLNRRAYEEELEKLNHSIPDNLICVSMDLTGLKRVNDNYGHAAGDELISEAGRLITETLGKFGKIFRTGGDEYYGLLQADINEYEDAKKLLDKRCEEWSGTYSNNLKVAAGAATFNDLESKDILELCKLADERMYQEKTQWYEKTGMTRRIN